MSGAVVAWVSVAVLAAWGPRGRGAAAIGIAVGIAPAPRARGGRAGVLVGRVRRRVRAMTARGTAARGTTAREAATERDLVAVVTEVISGLRAGADPGHAWERALGHPVSDDGTPDPADLAALLAGGATDARAQAASVIAAGRLAGVLGAPLAQVLESTAAGLARSAEADADRRAALAGPRATARLLTWLPLLAVGLGAVVGADPVGVLLDGGTGTVALASGVALVLVGRAWIARLVRSAARAGAAE